MLRQTGANTVREGKIIYTAGEFLSAGQRAPARLARHAPPSSFFSCVAWILGSNHDGERSALRLLWLSLSSPAAILHSSSRVGERGVVSSCLGRGELVFRVRFASARRGGARGVAT